MELRDEDTPALVARLVERIAALENKLYEPEFDESCDADDEAWWGGESVLARGWASVWQTLAPPSPRSALFLTLHQMLPFSQIAM